MSGVVVVMVVSLLVELGCFEELGVLVEIGGREELIVMAHQV